MHTTAAVFNGAMVELTRLIAGEVARGYDFAGMRRIVDVGGGHGALLAAVLAVHPRMQGVIFDLPHAIAGAKTYLAKEGVSERCELIAAISSRRSRAMPTRICSRTSFTIGTTSAQSLILRNCRRAMPTHGKLLLIEQITPGRAGSFAGPPRDRLDRSRDADWTGRLSAHGSGVSRSARVVRARSCTGRSRPRWTTASLNAPKQPPINSGVRAQ